MSKRIYMNHLIKDKRTKEPVIAVEDDAAGGVVYGNEVLVLGPSRVVHKKLTGRAGHVVAAYVETESRVRVL